MKHSERCEVSCCRVLMLLPGGQEPAVRRYEVEFSNGLKCYMPFPLIPGNTYAVTVEDRDVAGLAP